MWTALHDSILNHPKIVKLAARLGISKVQARGHLVTLWASALNMAPDGDLSSFSIEDVEVVLAEWTGESGVFVSTCADLRLLEEVVDGYAIHDFGSYAKAWRAANRKSQERERKRAGRGSRLFAIVDLGGLDGGGNRYRIGFSVDPERRLNETKRETGRAVALVVDHETEPEGFSDVRDRLSHLRIGNTSWYSEDITLTSWVEDVGLGRTASRDPRDISEKVTRPETIGPLGHSERTGQERIRQDRLPTDLGRATQSQTYPDEPLRPEPFDPAKSYSRNEISAWLFVRGWHIRGMAAKPDGRTNEKRVRDLVEPVPGDALNHADETTEAKAHKPGCGFFLSVLEDTIKNGVPTSNGKGKKKPVDWNEAATETNSEDDVDPWGFDEKPGEKPSN